MVRSIKQLGLAGTRRQRLYATTTNNSTLLPLFAADSMIAVCAALGIECIVAEREADRCLAALAR